MAEYEGMRWFKSDFQVQTPEDGVHWADDDTRLAEPRRPMELPLPDANGLVGLAQPNEQRLQEVARAYLRRCHAVGLELIGVTDHNFSQKTEPRDWFLTHLVEQNKSVARELGRDPLCILPGFEVDIGYHVLCLFEPAKKVSHVWRVNRLLCKLGLDENERFRQGRPMPLRRNGANVSLKELIELVQDEHKGIVIGAHSDQNDGLLSDPRHMEDYKNQKLLALEVTSNPPVRRILDIIEGRDRSWARSDCHPAYVMSSDAKSLRQDEHGAPNANSLGYRYSWLKMSKPSVEALRQAFLDPQSRVHLLGERPSDAQTHPRISSISVRGAKFLQDQELVFSEGLNCIIGGRGSGKSSLLEYLRFAIGLDLATAPDKTSALGRKREQLKESLSTPGAEVRVAFQAEGGVADTLVYTPSNPPDSQRRIDGREVADLQTVLRQLRVQFFSQGELSRMTGDGGAGQAQVLALIDASSGKPLAELQAQEHALQTVLKTLFQATRDEQRLIAEINVASQEAVELERQLQARAAVQGDSTRDQLARQANRFLDELSSGIERNSKAIADLIEALATPVNALPETAKDWPAAAWFSDSTQAVNSAQHVLTQDLTQALQRYGDTVAKSVGADAAMLARDAIRAAQEQFEAACAEKGIQASDIARLQELEEARQGKLKLVEDRQLELAQVTRLADEFPGALSSLHDVWKQQFQLRKETADAIQASVASQTVRVTTAYMQDKTSFLAEWKRLAPRDGRGKLARRWDELGDDLFNSWLQRGTEASPWETVEAGRTDPRAIMYFTGGPPGDDLQPALIEHIDSKDVRQIWEGVRITRISDGIDVELLRDDQTTAGTMSGALSEGQRNTVLLNLMLARGDGPIVIDQPEDELDSSFIYKTLVKDLRATKQKRQLIIATHNANLPVNGDAEFIYALEARDGKGKTLAEGGLDRAPVARAVLDIMEGSEQAFKRRSEKYHF
ncbi:RecF/RecN/SMC N terminal domain-containing protein [Variovorax sp. YR752]|uniref:TrlF family AAA-like ATPase n=1 Tax=Variovorax sp. YR752 TaxID=1884383 RepID=UPI000BDB58DE|nr:AAA family ATPase [Variovorax sp. YR752]SOD24067.1 RecF/RecN/SMC N terminal domain-containing protein [Variovorax sp. YR752]